MLFLPFQAYQYLKNLKPLYIFFVILYLPGLNNFLLTFYYPSSSGSFNYYIILKKLNQCDAKKRPKGRLNTFSLITYHLRLGCLAAFTSSNFLTEVLWGAFFTSSGFFSISSDIFFNVSINRFNVSTFSVSVGSIIIASLTTNGKYIVGAYCP